MSHPSQVGSGFVCYIRICHGGKGTAQGWPGAFNSWPRDFFRRVVWPHEPSFRNINNNFSSEICLGWNSCEHLGGDFSNCSCLNNSLRGFLSRMCHSLRSRSRCQKRDVKTERLKEWVGVKSVWLYKKEKWDTLDETWWQALPILLITKWFKRWPQSSSQSVQGRVSILDGANPRISGLAFQESLPNEFLAYSSRQWTLIHRHLVKPKPSCSSSSFSQTLWNFWYCLWKHWVLGLGKIIIIIIFARGIWFSSCGFSSLFYIIQGDPMLC